MARSPAQRTPSGYRHSIAYIQGGAVGVAPSPAGGLKPPALRCEACLRKLVEAAQAAFALRSPWLQPPGRWAAVRRCNRHGTVGRPGLAGGCSPAPCGGHTQMAVGWLSENSVAALHARSFVGLPAKTAWRPFTQGLRWRMPLLRPPLKRRCAALNVTRGRPRTHVRSHPHPRSSPAAHKQVEYQGTALPRSYAKPQSRSDLAQSRKAAISNLKSQIPTSPPPIL